MKSKLFQRFDLDDKENEAFKTDLSRALSRDDPTLKEFVASLLALSGPITTRQREKLLQQLATSTGTSWIDANSIVGVLHFFARKMADEALKSDSDQLWAEDLQGAGILNPRAIPSFLHLLGRIRTDVLPEFAERDRERQFTVGILPYLETVGHTVELRAVLSSIDAATDGDVERRLLRTVPVASFHIGLNTGTITNFFFQASTPEIEMLTRELSEALEELELLKGSRAASGDKAKGRKKGI